MQKLEERVTPRGFDSGPIGLSPPVPAANQAVVSLSPPHASPGRPPIPKRRGGSVVLFGTPPGDRDVYRFWGRLGCRRNARGRLAGGSPRMLQHELQDQYYNDDDND